jgi:hypothetical protein
LFVLSEVDGLVAEQPLLQLLFLFQLSLPPQFELSLVALVRL